VLGIWGFPLQPPCRNKYSSNEKEEMTHLECQIPPPLTALVAVISSTGRGLVESN